MSYRSSLDYEEARGGNYLLRHWRGHLSLPVSYWVNGVLLAGIVGFAALVLVGLIENSGLSLQGLAMAYLVYLAFAGLLWLWIMVGIWRSAGYHEERGGAAGWATVARILVVLGFFGVLAQSQNTTLSAVEYARLAAGDDPMGDPAEMSVQADGTSVLVDGSLALGTAAKFKSLVTRTTGVNRILLRSAGGRAFEAEQMAKLVAAQRLDTEVKEECTSACTLILLAGRERSAVPAARVGFHQPTFPGMSPEERHIATSGLRQLYEEAGVAPEFLDKAMTVAPESMWYPRHGELIEANVLNTTDVVVSKKDREIRRAQLARYLNHTADQLNAAGRLQVDEITTRTGAAASDDVLTLRYTIDLELEELDVAAGKPKMQSAVKKDTCGDRYMRQAVRTGATVVYAYEDRSARRVFDLTVDECEEP